MDDQFDGVRSEAAEQTIAIGHALLQTGPICVFRTERLAETEIWMVWVSRNGLRDGLVDGCQGAASSDAPCIRRDPVARAS